jgi:TonB-dependent receptor
MRNSRTLLSIAIAAALVTAATQTLAQQGTNSSGTAMTKSIAAPAVRGQIADQRGDFMSGVQVQLQGSNRQVATDSQGRFRFDGLEAGTYQLNINYLGFQQQTLTAVVTAQQGQELTIVMQPVMAQDLETILVVGVRDGQSKALNAQRAANNIKSVVSADYLGRFPDGNVAESMQRLPGAAVQRDQGEGKYVNVRGAPREFANVSVDNVILPSPDGGSRAIDLDTIPSDIIASLELTKALTPNMDADAIAGTINIVTRGALDSSGRIFRANASGGRNQQGGGDVYKLGLMYGDRLLGNDDIGFIVSANHSETNRETDNIETEWEQTASGAYVPIETQFKDYELTRIRSGITARVDMRPSDNVHFYLSHNYSRFEDNEFRDNLVVSWDRLTAASNEQSGVAGRTTFDKELRHRTFINTINSTVFGGNHFFDAFELDYSVALSTASQEYPNRDYLIYREHTRPAVAYDFADPDLPTFQVLGANGSVLRSDFNFPASNYAFRRYERRLGDAEDKEQAYTINATVPIQFSNFYSSTMFGAKIRLKEKFDDEDRLRNSVGNGAPAFADASISTQSLPFDGTYNNGPKLIRNFVSQYGPALESTNFLPLLEASTTSDYQASEDTYAVYGMSTLEFTSTTVLLGLRAERTSTAGTAAEFDLDTEEVVLLKADNSYTRLFPSAHLRYEMDNGVILRTSYTTGISRPNFTDLVPYQIVEDRESGRGSVEIGNIDLDPTYAHNFDVMGEYYVEPLGLISGGLFYKSLKDPVFKARSTVAGGQFDGFSMVRPENADSGKLYGFELNWQQTLDFLPGYWGGLGFAANYTRTSSSADLPFNIGSTDLPGTSKNTMNLVLQYDIAALSAQLSYNKRSAWIDSVDTSDPSLSTYWDGRATVDFTASYKVNDNLSVFTEASNLTDTKGLRYQGSRSRVFEHEQFGRVWQLGVRGTF